MRRALVAVVLLLGSLSVSAQSAWAFTAKVTPNPIVRGGAAAVVVEGAPVKDEVRGTFENRPVFFIEKGRRRIGLMGVDVIDKPGPHRLVISAISPDGRRESKGLEVVVEDVDYGARRLRVDKAKVELSPADLARHRREKRRVQAALATISPIRLWRGPFLRPIPGEVVSNFGRKTFINGQPRKKPHTGVDLRGDEGVPVKAPARGKVLLAEFHFFAGGSIYLDHGQGLITMYFHLSKIEVKAGQMVGRGQIIGRVGATGRVTGPHLHYGLYLNGARIDPLAFQALTERLGMI